MSEKSFEEAINELEKIVTKLESGSLPLEEGITNFEEGMRVAKYCNTILENAEKRIVKVIEENGTITEKELE